MNLKLTNRERTILLMGLGALVVLESSGHMDQSGMPTQAEIIALREQLWPDKDFDTLSLTPADTEVKSKGVLGE